MTVRGTKSHMEAKFEEALVLGKVKQFEDEVQKAAFSPPSWLGDLPDGLAWRPSRRVLEVKTQVGKTKFEHELRVPNGESGKVALHLVKRFESIVGTS